MSLFDQVFAALIGAEGGYTADPRDPGNWTGGAVNQGTCHGTNWGISAAAFPQLDIKSLSREDAAGIYRTHYWAPIGGDHLPGPLALLVFDAAVNNGVDRAVRWLQQALGLQPDGVAGPQTLAAIAAHPGTGAALCADYLAYRTNYMARLPTWQVFGLGWARRLCALPFTCMEMTNG